MGDYFNMREVRVRYDRVLALDGVSIALAEGQMDVSPLITGEVGLDGVGQAFDDLADPERHCKILVTP